MRRLIPAACVLLVLWSLGSAGQQTSTVFEGARLITGDGTPPIENASFVVVERAISAVGKKGQLRVPSGARRVDLSGKTVMPAIIDGHVHPGYRKGLTFSADNYTRDTILDTLDRFAYYGVAAVLEAGTGRGALPFSLRLEAPRGALLRTAGSGFAKPNAGPGVPMRDAAYGVTSESDARRAVRELAAKSPD